MNVSVLIMFMLVTLVTNQPVSGMALADGTGMGGTGMVAPPGGPGTGYYQQTGSTGPEFGSLIAGYIQALNKYQQLYFANMQAQAQNGFFGGAGFPGFPTFPAFSAPFPAPFLAPLPPFPIGIPAGGHGAAASASINSGMTHQTASLTPENLASPNVDVTDRLSGSPTISQGPPGVSGVSVFSSSSSSNINGKETVHREAGTSVLENGQVTTYTVKD